MQARLVLVSTRWSPTKRLMAQHCSGTLSPPRSAVAVACWPLTNIDSIDRLIKTFIPYNLYGEDTWTALSTVDFNRLLYPPEQIRKWDRETAWPNRFSAPDNG